MLTTSFFYLHFPYHFQTIKMKQQSFDLTCSIAGGFTPTTLNVSIIVIALVSPSYSRLMLNSFFFITIFLILFSHYHHIPSHLSPHFHSRFTPINGETRLLFHVWMRPTIPTANTMDPLRSQRLSHLVPQGQVPLPCPQPPPPPPRFEKPSHPNSH